MILTLKESLWVSCDADINLAQRLLRAQFPELDGLQSTLLQQGRLKKILEKTTSSTEYLKKRCYKSYIVLVAITGW